MAEEEMPAAIDESTVIQVQIGGNIPIGTVAMVIYNCPLTEVEGSIHPAFRLTIDQAQNVGMNLIHMAKMAQIREMEARPIAETEAERCSHLTRAGQCVLKRGHGGNHGVIENEHPDAG